MPKIAFRRGDTFILREARCYNMQFWTCLFGGPKPRTPCGFAVEAMQKLTSQEDRKKLHRLKQEAPKKRFVEARRPFSRAEGGRGATINLFIAKNLEKIAFWGARRGFQRPSSGGVGGVAWGYGETHILAENLRFARGFGNKLKTRKFVESAPCQMGNFLFSSTAKHASPGRHVSPLSALRGPT